MRGAVAGALGIGRLSGGRIRGFEADFDSLSGERAVAVFDFAGEVGGQFFANMDNTKTFADLFTFSRASEALYRNSSGVYITAASGAHRLDHDVSGNRIGIWIEEARENLKLWSDDWTNAAYDTVTNITALKDQIGADGVSNSASSLLATAGNAIITQSITSSSATRVYSVHIKRITGTGNIELTQDGGSTWLDIKASINSSTYTQVATASAAVANPVVGIRIVTDTDKIAVQYGDSEIGSELSSPIPTTTVAVPRAAETCDVATSAFAYNNEGANTAYIKMSVASVVGSPTPIQIHDGSTDEHILTRVTAGGPQLEFTVRDASTTLATISAGTPVANTVHKMSVAYELNNVNLSFDGASGTADTTVTMPSVTTVSIGYRGSASGDRRINGHVEEVVFYNVRLSDADNNGVTT